MKKNKILIVDPNNTVEYTFGLLKNMSLYADVTYITKKKSSFSMDDIKIKKIFYSDSTKSKLYMGINYLMSYVYIILYSIFKRIDVIHIQWFKLEKIDPFLINILKKRTRVVYTAHNVLPHVNGNAKMQEYKNIYESVDEIVVHGSAIKKEMISLFPGLEDKIFIQPYGFCMLENPLEVVEDDFIQRIKDLKSSSHRLVMCLGLINRYKGTDRILKIWNDEYGSCNDNLIIAGKIIEMYDELEHEITHKSSNVIIKNRHLTDFEFKELAELADIIVLPYRNASMSGVIYAAARASTAVLTTNSGTIPEYLENGYDSIVVNNNDDSLLMGLETILSYDKGKLKKLGCNLHENFDKKFEWGSIVKKIIKDCYKL